MRLWRRMLPLAVFLVLFVMKVGRRFDAHWRPRSMRMILQLLLPWLRRMLVYDAEWKELKRHPKHKYTSGGK